MKLCNHRYPKRGEGACHLRVCDVSGQPWRYDSPYVFAKEGALPSYWMRDTFECTERMAEVCPYQTWSPEPPKPKLTWVQCLHCKGKHHSEWAINRCKAYECFDKAMRVWDAHGTKDSPFSQDVLSFKQSKLLLQHLWPGFTGKIIHRDKCCQDCGAEYSGDTRIEFEVHHIIPRGLGGSDHPANLKLVCKNCHTKYNEKFNGEIISRKARERKVKQLRLHKLDDF